MALVLNVLVGGYVEHWAWTGYRGPKRELRTLWDWLGVSVLPLAVAFTPLWLRTRGRRRTWRIAAVSVASLLGLLALGGYLLRWKWTGFTGNTLYDWLDLFLVPCVLPVAFAVLAPREAEASLDQHGSGGRDTCRETKETWATIPAFAAAVAALLMVGTVAALIAGRFGAITPSVSRDPDQMRTMSPSSAASASSGASHRWLIVESQDPWWTDTGIHVTAGENVTISAIGNVRAGPDRNGYEWTSAAGINDKSAPKGHASISRAVGHAALVATVGVPGRVGRLDTSDPPKIIGVGRHRLISIPRSGELLLGLNDRKVRDNRGWFGATITLPHSRS